MLPSMINVCPPNVYLVTRWLYVSVYQAHVRIWNSISLNTLKVIGIGLFERAVCCLAFSKLVCSSTVLFLFVMHLHVNPHGGTFSVTFDRFFGMELFIWSKTVWIWKFCCEQMTFLLLVMAIHYPILAILQSFLILVFINESRLLTVLVLSLKNVTHQATLT